MHRIALACLFLALAGCPPRQRTTKANPPPGCESDPKCAARQQMYDCSRQCSDDPACEERCREINVSAGNTGR